MLLPSALGSSPYPPVSVFGTGPVLTIAAFLGSVFSSFATLFRSSSHITFPDGAFPPSPLTCLIRLFHFRLRLSHRVPTVLYYRSTGISTCPPSATPFGLALGPGLPGADQLHPGNLGYSAVRILTLLSLLIPAFSLQRCPRLLSVPLLPPFNAPLPLAYILRHIQTHGFGAVFQPRVFSARDLSTSELLRTL